MQELTKRLEQVEQDTHQIRIDVATLTEQAKSFATRASVEALTERCANFVTKAEFNGKLHDFEVRLNARLDGMDKRMDQRYEKMDERHMAMMARLDSKVDSIGSKIFWGIFFPGMTVAIGWFIRNAVMT